ncbi:MAG: hypothetical protein R6W96_08310 [Clostridia bacterium]
MSGKGFSRIADVLQTRWIPGCPVEIVEGLLLRNERTRQYILRLRLRNVGAVKVHRVEVLVRRNDSEGNPGGTQEDAVTAVYENIPVFPKKTFGSRKRIMLGVRDMHGVTVIFHRVAMAKGTIWENAGMEEGLENDAPLLSEALEAESYHQFIRSYKESYPDPGGRKDAARRTRMPFERGHAWYCTCGFINLDAMRACGRCGVDKNWLFSAVRNVHATENDDQEAQSFRKDMERQRRIRTEEKQKLIRELRIFHERTQPIRQEEGNQKYNRKKAVVAILFFNLVIALLVYLLLRTIF